MISFSTVPNLNNIKTNLEREFPGATSISVSYSSSSRRRLQSNTVIVQMFFETLSLSNSAADIFQGTNTTTISSTWFAGSGLTVNSVNSPTVNNVELVTPLPPPLPLSLSPSPSPPPRVSFDFVNNWGYIPIEYLTNIDDLFRTIDTTDLTIISAYTYIGGKPGGGFYGSANPLQPNVGFFIRNNKPATPSIQIPYSVPDSYYTGSVTFSSVNNWGYIPIRNAISIDTLFNDIDTTDLTIISAYTYIGGKPGGGFYGSANLLQPNVGFFLRNNKPATPSITVNYQ